MALVVNGRSVNCLPLVVMGSHLVRLAPNGKVNIQKSLEEGFRFPYPPMRGHTAAEVKHESTIQKSFLAEKSYLKCAGGSVRRF